MERGAWIDPRPGWQTLQDWSTQWLDSDPAKRAKTRFVDGGIIRNHIVPELGDFPLPRFQTS